jgi:hypothetical protein
VRIIICLFLWLFNSAVSLAYVPKAGNVTATFGPQISQTISNGSRSGADNPLQNGYGLIALGDVNDYGALEIGTFYMPKIFIREAGGKFLSEKTQTMHITLGYRYWLAPSFSTSLTFYSAYSMGSYNTLHSDFPAGQTEKGTSAQDYTEYGFDLALQAEVWSSGRYGIVIDGRYSQSVTNKPSEDANHYAFLIGLRYLIQEKVPNLTKQEKADKDALEKTQLEKKTQDPQDTHDIHKEDTDGADTGKEP